jgi:hypothetical protein
MGLQTLVNSIGVREVKGQEGGKGVILKMKNQVLKTQIKDQK